MSNIPFMIRIHGDDVVRISKQIHAEYPIYRPTGMIVDLIDYEYVKTLLNNFLSDNFSGSMFYANYQGNYTFYFLDREHELEFKLRFL